MMYLLITNGVLVVVGLLNLFFGSAVVFNARSNTKVQRRFAVIAIATALWTLTIAFFRQTDSPLLAYYALKVLYCIPLVIPISFVYFTSTYCSYSTLAWLNVRAQRTFLVAAVLLFLATAFTEHIVAQVTLPAEGEKVILFGAAYLLYVVYFVVVLSWGFLQLYSQMNHAADVVARRQARYLLIGTVSGSVVSLVSNLVLPWFGVFQVNWVGNVFTILFVGFIFYAVVRHKLFDLRTAAAEIFVVTLWVVLLLRTLFSESVGDFMFEFSVLLASVVLGVLLVRNVITEIKNREKGEQLARYLANANARLRELDRQKTEFVSVASHQLRSPIAAIVGYTANLMDGLYGPVPDSLQQPIARVLESGKRISIIVDDFLNVTRIEQGRMSYDMQKTDLCAVVAKAVDELQILVEQKGITFTCTCPEEVVYVRADEGKLKQIFSNLVDNAIKYTPKGSISVTVSLGGDGSRALVAVKDTGIGIDSEEVSKLFHKFNRASNANTANVHGTGLGLYIAQEIMKAHQGWIHVASPGVGKGSTFTVELPLYNENKELETVESFKLDKNTKKK
jgi:signal transduction histidine kinase